MTDIFAKLAAPFPPDRISWRVGPTTQDKSKGQALAFIDARDVMERLDAVCGAFWSCEYVPMHNGTCCCRIGVMFEGQWVYRSNGAITLTDSDKPDMKEMAEKGSYSDAFKRAAVLWGIGRYLYDIDSPWVAIVPAGRSYKFADGVLDQLQRLLVRSGAASQKAENKPTNGADDPVTIAKHWGKVDAIQEIKGCKDKRSLETWIAENAKRRTYLRKVADDLADGVDHAIIMREQAFNVLNAG